MITKSDVEKAHLKRHAQELKDLDVDRVDGVDKPATGRHFLLFKAVDPEDAVRTYVDAGPPRVPRYHDDGTDVLGRDYDDAAFDRLAGANGKGSSVETGLPDGEQENFAEDQGGDLVSPLTPYENKELGEAGSQPVRVGPNFMMSPQASGIATPLDFKAPEPAPVAKRSRGLFRSVLDPDSGPSRTGNYFDPAPDDAKIAKSKGGLFTSAVFDGE